jgi:DNA-binding XRE family transcriptional regulator
LTQEKLAELADLNIRTVQKIEAGELNVLITTAIRLQRALGCAWESLLPVAKHQSNVEECSSFRGGKARTN